MNPTDIINFSHLIVGLLDIPFEEGTCSGQRIYTTIVV